MSKMKFCLALALLSTSFSPAQAQFGGIASKIPGLGGGGASNSGASATDIDAYLVQSMETAVLIGVAAALLSDAKYGKIDRAASAATVRAIRGSANPREAGAALSFMRADDQATGLNASSAQSLETNMASASADDRAIIGTALINLAIGLPRAVKLAAQAPGLIAGMATNPASLGKVGKLKDVAALIGLEIKYTADIVPILPKLMLAAKVKMPANPATSRPVPFAGEFN